MELPNILINPSIAAVAAVASGIIGALLWWLIRKRQKRIWLPTIRVVELENRVMPKLVLMLPPLVAFLCFLVLAMALSLFAFKPRTQVFTPFEPNQTRVHLFVDLSPSVSAQLSLPDYAARLSDTFKTLQETGRVTVSTSHSAEIMEPATPEELAEKLRSLGYHRAGLKLGAAMKAMMDALGDVDRLFIASDRDQHSWTGFNWHYLQDEMDVSFIDLTSQGKEKSNFFVSNAVFLSNVTSQTMDWEVEIARGGTVGEANGNLVVQYSDQTELARTTWKISEGKTRTTARLGWPASLVIAGKVSEVPDNKLQSPLVFRIEPNLADHLSDDNQLRMPLLGIKQNALLIAETNGERPLEDPAKQLSISLEILGFRTKRYDFIQGEGPRPEDYPFLAILGGFGSGIDHFCPESLAKARHQAKAIGVSKRSFPKVWLAPHTLEADYGELCQCYARLLKDGDSASYCQHVTSRSQWVGLLPSLGAKQIGGELGEAAGSIAFLGKDTNTGLEVLAFTVPLEPSLRTGISHATMPVIVRDLLQWQGLLQMRGKAVASAWPRFDDIVTALWNNRMRETEIARVRESNVPVAESLLVEMEGAFLPPRWTSQIDPSARIMPVKKDREDPLPWLKIGILIAMVALAFEAVWVIAHVIWRWLVRRPQATSLILIGLVVPFVPKAHAKVELGLLGYTDASMSFTTLAREVTHRTSIELAVRPDRFAKLTPTALGQPWVWVTNLELVTAQAASLRPEVLLWLRRGGFLVIESPATDAALSLLAARLLPDKAAQDAAFLPIPPDHELMRSFYLLDALPQCNGQIWRGLAYDGRLAILVIPFRLLDTLKDRGASAACPNAPDYERSVRIFVNLVMVALATDYKKDQIHLPEILKRLR